jgi:hypothetical protein
MLNLKSKKIELYVTDSTGNILRNSNISVKMNNGYDNLVVSNGKTDSSGKFTSSPLPCGVYQIFESNNYVCQINHFFNNEIQCFKPLDYNIFKNSYCNFVNNIGPSGNLNNFRWFLQIEPENIDIESFGSTYPLYDYQLGSQKYSGMINFFGFDSDSRISTTRFDVDYYTPVTKFNTTQKFIRWAGVPAIRFKPDSKLVIPLDYYSIVPKFYKITKTASFFDPFTETITISDSSGINVGDIIKVDVTDIWYGLVQDIIVISENNLQIYMKKWMSSRFESADLSDTYDNTPIYVYDGLFNNITEIVDVNSNFLITENNYAQNNETELYNYLGTL